MAEEDTSKILLEILGKKLNKFIQTVEKEHLSEK